MVQGSKACAMFCARCLVDVEHQLGADGPAIVLSAPRRRIRCNYPVLRGAHTDRRVRVGAAKPRPLRPVRARASVGNTDCPPETRPGVASNNSPRSLRSPDSDTFDGLDDEAREYTRRCQAKSLPAPLTDCPHRSERPRLCFSRVGRQQGLRCGWWRQRRVRLRSARVAASRTSSSHVAERSGVHRLPSAVDRIDEVRVG
jgi:hypothetical protein